MCRSRAEGRPGEREREGDGENNENEEGVDDEKECPLLSLSPPFLSFLLLIMKKNRRREEKASETKVREPSEGGIHLSSPSHLPPSYAFVSVFYSFL